MLAKKLSFARLALSTLRGLGGTAPVKERQGRRALFIDVSCFILPDQGRGRFQRGGKGKKTDFHRVFSGVRNVRNGKVIPENFWKTFATHKPAAL
jgi:hypothetical protein